MYQNTVDYFINKFNPIPEEKWITDKFIDDNNCCCAYGHCGARVTAGDTQESIYLWDLFHRNKLSVSMINDGTTTLFQQSTPKQRILAALYYIKKQQENGTN